MNNNFYPLKWIERKIGEEQVSSMTITHGKRDVYRSYLFADNNGEWLLVNTDNRHNITHVAFTPKYKGVGLSLKRALKKKMKVCWYYFNKCQEKISTQREG